MRILLWHVHGSWTTAFVQGTHQYLVPVTPDRGPDGRGRALTWDWPSSVVEVTPEEAKRADIDLVLLQRPEELESLAESWTGRRPGRDVPAVYLEHNTPGGLAEGARHPAADNHRLQLVHVTPFNDLYWDSGSTPTTVIEHGIVDPGYQYRGSLPRAVAVINDPCTRRWTTGADLVEEFRDTAPVDLFGMRSGPLEGEELPQRQLHREMAGRRVYLHANRWTSLGLSLIEAMHLGMPVVGTAATETAEAVPADAGIVSNDTKLLREAMRRLIEDPDEARSMGHRARQAALHRYGLKRFLDDWDHLMEEVTR